MVGAGEPSGGLCSKSNDRDNAQSTKNSGNGGKGASQVQKGDLRKASQREGTTSPAEKSLSKRGQGDGVGGLHIFTACFSMAQNPCCPVWEPLFLHTKTKYSFVMQAQYNQLKLCSAPSIAHLFTPKGVRLSFLPRKHCYFSNTLNNTSIDIFFPFLLSST